MKTFGTWLKLSLFLDKLAAPSVWPLRFLLLPLIFKENPSENTAASEKLHKASVNFWANSKNLKKKNTKSARKISCYNLSRKQSLHTMSLFQKSFSLILLTTLNRNQMHRIMQLCYNASVKVILLKRVSKEATLIYSNNGISLQQRSSHPKRYKSSSAFHKGIAQCVFLGLQRHWSN